MRKYIFRTRALALAFALMIAVACFGMGTLADASSESADLQGATSSFDDFFVEDAEIPIVEFVPVDAFVGIVPEDDDINRVTFYDWYGAEIEHIDVPHGESIDPPEETPTVDGYAFQFWFDEVGELAPYPFGEAPVEENLNLLPHYEVLPPLNGTRPMSDESADELILGILGEHASTDLLETPIDILVPEISRPPAAIEIIGSDILPASDRVAHVLTGTPEESPKESPEDVIAALVGQTQEKDVPELLTIQEIIPVATATPTATPALVEMKGMQVSTLIAEILETGSLSTPTPPQLQTIAPVATPAPTAEPAPPRTPRPDATPTLPPEQPSGNDALADRLNQLLGNMLDTPPTARATQQPGTTKSIGTLPPEPTPLPPQLPTPTPSPSPSPESEPTEAPPTAPPGPEETQPPSDPTPEPSPAATEAPTPYVDVRYDYAGELTIGTRVTLMAFVHNVSEGQQLTFQWQNDASGTYQDVPGANSQVHTFVIDSNNARGWNWRVNVSIDGS